MKKSSRTKYILPIYLLILLSIIIVSVSFIFLPDIVPMHYNGAGQVDRMGSKYENLLFIGINLLISAIFLSMSRYSKKKHEDFNQKILLITNSCLLVFFNILTIYFLYQQFTYSSQSEINSNGLFSLVGVLIGVLCIVLGLFMPRLSLNAMMGLRTSWSMYNEITWSKSQKLGGINFIVCGLIMILVSILFQGILGVIVALSILIIGTVISCIGSYRIYLKEKIYEEREK